MLFCGLTACAPKHTVEPEIFAAAVSEADVVFSRSHDRVPGSDLTQAGGGTSVPLQDFKLALSVLVPVSVLAWLGGVGVCKRDISWSVVFSWVLSGPCIPLDWTKRSTGPFVVLQFWHSPSVHELQETFGAMFWLPVEAALWQQSLSFRSVFSVCSESQGDVCLFHKCLIMLHCSEMTSLSHYTKA